MTSTFKLAADAAVDLHLHTFASDGIWKPVELVDYLAEHDFQVIAVCDHDTQKSVIEARERAAHHGIHFVPGVEMTVTWNDRPWHVLVYGIAPDSEDPLARHFLDLVTFQERRNREIAMDAIRRVERSGRPIPSAPSEIVGPNHLPVHVLRAMINEKHVASLKEAAELVVELGGLFTTHVDLGEVVAATHRAGGVAVLAHPGRSDLGPVLDEEMLVKMLAEVPIDGLETNYRTYTDAVTAQFRDLADRHHLLKEAGSDSHGPKHPVDPRPWQAAWSRDLLTRLGFEVEPREVDWTIGMDTDVASPPEEKVAQPEPATAAAT
ncbi:MAG: PHP domain-containing protein [Thermomicrobiales bacterium]